MPKAARYWDDRNPLRRRTAWPKWKPGTKGQPDTADVVIVGGGLTGAACAHVFAAAGHDVVLLEAARVASGATAGSAGLLLPAFDGSYRSHDAAHGRRASRAMWQQARKGVLEFAALIRRLGIRCDLEATSVVTVAADDKAQAKEYAARRVAGLPVTKIAASAMAREAAVDKPGRGGIRTPDAFTFDPVRAALGLITHASRKGARVFEQSPVVRITHLPRNKGVIVKTAAGTIEAASVIVATNAAGPLVPQLRRHFSRRHTYVAVSEPMPAAMRRAVGQRVSALMDDADPPHSVLWLRDDRVLVSGADQKEQPARKREAILRQRTGQLMYELSLFYPDISGLQPAFAWDAPIVSTADGAPYIGPHRNLPGHLFALGFGRHGDGLAVMAAKTLLRYHEGAPHKDDGVFGFTRHDG